MDGVFLSLRLVLKVHSGWWWPLDPGGWGATLGPSVGGTDTTAPQVWGEPGSVRRWGQVVRGGQGLGKAGAQHAACFSAQAWEAAPLRWEGSDPMPASCSAGHGPTPFLPPWTRAHVLPYRICSIVPGDGQGKESWCSVFPGCPRGGSRSLWSSALSSGLRGWSPP